MIIVLIPENLLKSFQKFDIKTLHTHIGKQINGGTETIIYYNWYCVALLNNLKIKSEYNNDDHIYITSDWFMKKNKKKYNLNNNKLLFFEASVFGYNFIQKNKSMFKIDIMDDETIVNYGYNLPFRRNNNYNINENYTNKMNVINKNNKYIIPLGSPKFIFDLSFKKNKSILLDYYSQLKHLKQLSHKSFEKSIDICKKLIKKGWCVNLLNFPFDIEGCNNIKGFITYEEMLKIYKNNTFFFTNILESHGWAICENLQMGNIVVIFEEHAHSTHLYNYINCIKLNLNFDSDICAELINNFYNIYSVAMFNKNIAFNNNCLSAETFIDRLKKTIN